VSNQNIPPEEPDSAPLTDSDDNQPLSSGTIVQKNLPTDAIATLPPSTNDQTKPPMEVHHHGHVHEKKKWKEYLFQFFMLFLAVFCGFLAEYQLEHYIEKQRAGEFAVSLHRDLTADTIELNNVIDGLKLCASITDTLIDLLGREDAIDKNTSAIYQSSVYVYIFPLMAPNESTLQQLINSGSLRYIKNDLLVDSIKGYNTRIQQLKNFANASAAINMEFRKMQLSVVEINPLLQYISHSNLMVDQTKQDRDSNFFQDVKLVATEKKILKEYTNWCALKKFYMLNSMQHYTALKVQAVGLLRLLNEEYHIK